MSCPNMVWALYRPGVTETERTILVHMANAATKGLICWDTMHKMAALFGMSIRTVHRAVHGLADKKLIRIQARFRQPNHYHLLMPEKDEDKRPPQPSDGDKHVHTQPLNGDRPVQESPSRVTNLATKGDKSGKSSVPKMAGVPPKKESPKKSEQDFSNPLLAGSKASKLEPEPAVVVDREAQAAEHAATLAALKPPLAFALSSLAASLSGIAYAPGRSPRLTPEEMRDALKPKREPARASPEAVAAIRALSAQRGRTYIPMGASP